MSEDASSRKSYQAGDMVANRFQILEALGSSEGGDVYLVQETERNKKMVLKHLAIPYLGDDGYEQLRAEIMEASSIRHKNLVQVFGLGKEQEDLFLAMEHVEGETLDKHLRSRRSRSQVMGLKAAYNVVAHICNALAVVHDANAVHGALTPRNIYITSQGRVKVANLVYAKLVSRYLAAEQRGAYFDSPFIAPEAKAGETLSQAADIFSLGLITAELLSDQSLDDFQGSPEQFIESVVQGRSQQIQDLLFSSVVQLPHIRPASVIEFKTRVREAVDAPGDMELSSIVMGVGELREIASHIEAADDEVKAKKPSLFDLPDLPPPVAKPAFEAAQASSSGEQEIWLVQRDGLDYGPFTRATVIEMLHRDEVSETTSALNMMTQRRAELADIPDFRQEVIAYLPLREERRRREAAERERKIEQVKKGGIVSGAGIAIGAGVVIVLSVIAYLQLPDPVPIEFEKAIATFPHTFEVPKIEEVQLKVDDAVAKAIFNPAASEAEREAALQAWVAEHQKKFASKPKRSKRPKPGTPGATGAAGEEIYEMSFGDGDTDLTPLEDWEVEEELYSAKSLRKQTECMMQHVGSRKKKVLVSFEIMQSGQVRNVSTNGGGELDSCLRSAFTILRFRAFGGTIKKVNYPLEWG
ncbi:MAG: protein kinase [Myxococcota bacterium]|jgi:serine/threonine protein kinase|nr:protein kinase [Myxococcota bacterium]